MQHGLIKIVVNAGSRGLVQLSRNRGWGDEETIILHLIPNTEVDAIRSGKITNTHAIEVCNTFVQELAALLEKHGIIPQVEELT